MPNYLDAETAFADWLAVELEAGPTGTHRRVVTEIPSDLFTQTGMPCHVVARIGGADVALGLDVARLDVDTYATGPDPLQSRAAVLARAEDVRRAVALRLKGRTIGGIGGAFVSRVRVESAPTIRPYDSRNQVRKATASYELRLHRPI